MIYCSNCGLANRDGAKFCNECGMRLGTTLPCPACGEPNLSTSRFCNTCGARTLFDSDSSLSHSQPDRQSASRLTIESQVVGISQAPTVQAVAGLDQVEAGPPAESVEVQSSSPAESAEAEIDELAPQSPLEAFAAPEIQDSEEPEDVTAATIAQDTASEVGEAGPFSSADVLDLEPAFSLAEPEPIGEPIAPGDEGTAPMLPAEPAEGPSNIAALVDDLLPSWLAEIDAAESGQNRTPSQPGTIEAEPSIELKTQSEVSEDRQTTSILPWEREDGIVVARSFAGRVKARGEEPVDEVDQMPSRPTSPWQPPTTSSDGDAQKEAAPRKKRSRVRWILIYLIIAVLLGIAATVVSYLYFPYIPEDIAGLLNGLSVPQ